MNIGPGTVLGGYRIERALGSGGMGTVYLAQHPALPRHDALKVLWPHHASDAEFRARFEREARLAATLDHPNIVTVHNKGEDEGCLWIALQYVPGTDAATAVERDPASMTAHRALRIVTEIGSGLDFAHRRGMLHRDIKPANFLLAPQDHGEERVLLADFGIAKQSDGSTELTRTGTFLATIAYASPEQLSGGQLDARSDIYSLACSFYRLVAGQTPFPGTQPLQVMMGHVNQPPPRLSALRPDLPPELDAVMLRALAKDPGQRFPSCKDFTDAAAAALAGYHSRTAPTVQNQVPVSSFARLAGGKAASERAEAGDRRQPLRTPPEKPLFESHRTPPMPRAEEPAFGHETERSPFRRRLAAGVGVLVVVAVLVFLLGKPGDGETRSAASGQTTVTSVSPASPSVEVKQDAPAWMQDPCELLEERYTYSPSAFGLGNVETPSSTAEQRRCDWRSLQQGSPTGAITLSTVKAPVESGSLGVRIADSFTAQQISIQADEQRNYSTCTLTWPISYGHIRIEMSNHFALTITLEELCGRVTRIAEAVYPRLRT